LRRQDRALRAEGSRHYSANIETFMSFFSREQIESTVRCAMGYAPPTAALPLAGSAAAPRGAHP
jgi:hypothetical protein